MITGTVSKSILTPNFLTYDLCLFGQHESNPLAQVITYKKIECKGYTEMQEIARQIYAKYYNTDLYNIVSIENINII
jgi:hypothetical protein